MLNESETMNLASGDYLAVVRDFAMSKGITPQALLYESQFTIEQLINPPPMINNMMVNRVGFNLYSNLPNPDCDVVEFGLAMPLATHGSLGLAVHSAPDIRSAYDVVVSYFNTRVNSLSIALERKGSNHILSIYLKQGVVTDDPRVLFFFDFATLISIASITQTYLNADDLKTKLRINVNQKEPMGFPHHLLPGAVEVMFDQESLELCIPEEWMGQPLASGNEVFAQAAMDKCQSELLKLSPKDTVTKVRDLVQNSLCDLMSLSQVANELHMSPATLKRRLKARGVTYQSIKDEERFKRAKALIQQCDLSMEEISDQLGFVDASNFTKAFKGWSGVTPKQFQSGQ
ncbi:AraC family transcriptional regulator [Litoribacillus peritrichatus]|uniref:AraC family transcriptional regulator n=1 Tax=Litoribacillus peritrichatus TaxID=718191 RepID=A0ABP7MAK4_9GAMM